MSLIDADELLEHVGRDRLDSRERIAQMIKNAPTVNITYRYVDLQNAYKTLDKIFGAEREDKE